MDLENDKDLMWIARAGLKARLKARFFWCFWDVLFLRGSPASPVETLHHWRSPALSDGVRCGFPRSTFEAPGERGVLL